MASEQVVKPRNRTKEMMKGVSSVLKEIAEFKGWEYLFQALLYGFVAWGGYALYIVYLFHHHENYAHVPKFSIHDFKLSIIPTLIFFLYKKFCNAVLAPWVEKRLDPAKFPTEEEKQQRALKAGIWLGNVIYYTFTSILSWVLFHDTFFFPGSLGGSGQCSNLYAHTPFVPNIPYAVFFYQMQFGWHFHTFIDHIVYKWREPKFWEMFLHHSVAVFLIFFSYLSNQIPVGILVLTTHDPSDIGLCGSRLYNDFKNKNYPLLISIYVGFVLSWIYLRLWIFPKCVVGEALTAISGYEPDMMYQIYVYMIVMMTALVILHFYWFVFIIRIVWNICTPGSKEYNLYDKKQAKKN